VNRIIVHEAVRIESLKNKEEQLVGGDWLFCCSWLVVGSLKTNFSCKSYSGFAAGGFVPQKNERKRMGRAVNELCR
jgi:hypothetical protein